MYAAYNVITAPKRLILAYDTGHQSTQEQVDDVNGWLGDELTGRHSSSAGTIGPCYFASGDIVFPIIMEIQYLHGEAHGCD